MLLLLAGFAIWLFQTQCGFCQQASRAFRSCIIGQTPVITPERMLLQLLLCTAHAGMLTALLVYNAVEHGMLLQALSPAISAANISSSNVSTSSTAEYFVTVTDSGEFALECETFYPMGWNQ